MAPRVLIFGTGAIGSVYAYLLSRQLSPSDLVCICRSNYETVKKDGFTINSTSWGSNLKAYPTVTRSVTEAVALSPHPFDYVIVTAKALPKTPSIVETIKPAVTTGTTAIVLIQNGIGIEHEYAMTYPDNPLLSTVVYLPATQTSPGVTSHKEIELLHVGTYPPSLPSSSPHQASAQAFVDLLVSCSANVRLHADVQFERWSKLLVNAIWNPICALTRSRDAEFIRGTPASSARLTLDDTTAYLRAVMREVASVARACGHTGIDDAMIDYQLGRAAKRDLPGVEPSMLADARAGRTMEVDAIIGNAVRIADEKGVDVPLLRANYVLLSALDASFERESEAAAAQVEKNAPS